MSNSGLSCDRAGMTDSSRETLRVYSREGCHLCEILIEELLPIIRDRMALEIVDIDASQQLRDTYNTRIPVIEYGSRFVCQYKLDVPAINALLAEYGNS